MSEEDISLLSEWALARKGEGQKTTKTNIRADLQI